MASFFERLAKPLAQKFLKNFSCITVSAIRFFCLIIVLQFAFQATALAENLVAKHKLLKQTKTEKESKIQELANKKTNGKTSEKTRKNSRIKTQNYKKHSSQKEAQKKRPIENFQHAAKSIVEEKKEKEAEENKPAEHFEKTTEEISEAKKEKTANAEELVRKRMTMSQKLWQGFDADDSEALKKISSSLVQKKYDTALFLAKQLRSNKIDSEKNPNSSSKKIHLVDALIDVILWSKFSSKIDAKKTSFSDISTFAIDNPFYPNINDLRKNVEAVAIINEVPYQASQQYFTINPASSSESKLFVVESKIEALLRSKIPQNLKDQERRDIQNQIAKIWVKENFSASEEKEFLQKYQSFLNEADHVNRIDRLLWEGRNDEANRIMNFVDEDHKILFGAIIEIQSAPKYIDKIVLRVPRKLRSNECLTYHRILWYKSKDKIDDLLELIDDLPSDSKLPEKWWSLRRLYGREMLKQKQYKLAYKFISQHNLPKNFADFWEAEWTSGWIALRFLDKPKIAQVHFENLYNNVSQPVVKARAAYWLGMCAEALDDKRKAIEWYKIGVKYPIFFYGQLALHKHRILDPSGSTEDIVLPKNPEITGKDIAKIAELRAAQVAYLLAISGNKTDATKIFEWVVNNSTTEGQIAVIMKIINEIGDREIDARISRVAAKKNVFFVREKFQIVNDIIKDEYAPLVHAIIKQESGFAPSALSKVGAIGFMQLMPATAKLVAKEIGIPYNHGKLATDIHYNVRLGSFYIKKLISRFDGSEMLAIASYNAGPNATQRWINEFYDPRKEKDLDKVIDWIELITYSETRNYVQRIMENLIVYKYLMSRNNYDNIQ